MAFGAGTALQLSTRASVVAGSDGAKLHRSNKDSQQRPFVLGITGPSGSGKSYTAAELCKRLLQGTNQQDSSQDHHRSSVVLFPEDPKFFKAPASASYKDRNPVSETPAHVDWGAYWNALQRFMLEQEKENSAALGSNRRVLIVEHFLLMHDPRVVAALDGLIFLDPEATTEGDDTCSHSNEKDAMWMCLQRRVERNPNRSSKEVVYMCRYYQDYVWPSYNLYTRNKARNMCNLNPHGTCLRIDCQHDAATILNHAEACVRSWIRKNNDVTIRFNN